MYRDIKDLVTKSIEDDIAPAMDLYTAKLIVDELPKVWLQLYAWEKEDVLDQHVIPAFCKHTYANYCHKTDEMTVYLHITDEFVSIVHVAANREEAIAA